MRKRLIVMASIAVAASLFLAPPAGAVVDMAHLTFSGPVRVPGATLAAGTYVFERVAPNILRVRSNDRSVLYTTFMTLPRWRNDQGPNRVVFGEAPAGTYPPVKIWFAPYQTLGDEFLYPKAVSPAPVAQETAVGPHHYRGWWRRHHHD